MFVVIELDPNEDEQQIFDTINSLGVKLTTGELLKNHLFSNINIKDYQTYWFPTFEQNQAIIDYWELDYKDSKTIDLFLFYYLQIKIFEPSTYSISLKKGDKKKYRRKKNLFDSFKKYTDFQKNNRVSIATIAGDIATYANTFHTYFKYKDYTQQTIPCNPGIERIVSIIYLLDVWTVIPYVLYILQNVSTQHGRDDIFDYLETYLVRRAFAKRKTNSYNDLFTEHLIGKQIDSRAKLKNYIEVTNAATDFSMPTNAEIINNFNAEEKNNSRALTLLYLMETKMNTTAALSILKSTLRSYSEYALEHLMPQKWQTHWTLPSNITADHRNFKIYTYGNLAIITPGLNSSFRNEAWTIKLNGRNGQNGLKTHANGVATMASVIQEIDWDESKIDARTAWLANQAINLWQP